jgi:hypothetical protein
VVTLDEIKKNGQRDPVMSVGRYPGTDSAEGKEYEAKRQALHRTFYSLNGIHRLFCY